MGVIQVRLPDEIQSLIDRQVAEGRVAGMEDFLAEAARRYAIDLERDDELAAEARAGIADIGAGRFRQVDGREDLVAMERGVMDRVRKRLTG